ncbi:hypothetical protein KKF91_00300, partial [Myxococcota bacterium]|nr:hypothetical protein [Myxococcota bacterium]
PRRQRGAQRVGVSSGGEDLRSLWCRGHLSLRCRLSGESARWGEAGKGGCARALIDDFIVAHAYLKVCPQLQTEK